jgi:hypothetical protein
MSDAILAILSASTIAATFIGRRVTAAVRHETANG